MPRQWWMRVWRECAVSEFTDQFSCSFKKCAPSLGITNLQVKQLTDHICYYISARHLGFFLNPRQGRSKITWMKEEDGKVVMDVSGTKDIMEEYPVKDGNVLVSVRSVWVFEPLDLWRNTSDSSDLHDKSRRRRKYPNSSSKLQWQEVSLSSLILEREV